MRPSLAVVGLSAFAQPRELMRRFMADKAPHARTLLDFLRAGRAARPQLCRMA